MSTKARQRTIRRAVDEADEALGNGMGTGSANFDVFFIFSERASERAAFCMVLVDLFI
jgi:hypothetical protein